MKLFKQLYGMEIEVTLNGYAFVFFVYSGIFLVVTTVFEILGL